MRNYFKDQSISLDEEEEVQLVMGFKEKIKLMKGSNEINNNFYTRPSRSVL